MVKIAQFLTVSAAAWLISSAAAGEQLDPAAVEFFENKIRPVLAENCYECHSQKSEEVKGGLFLDTRDGLLKGGDSGPAIVPGNPGASLLIRAVRYTDENLQMPPKDKKLSDAQIADLEHWIQIGAPDPRAGENPILAEREERVAKHWAFQEIASPEIPNPKNSAWVKNPIDAFILTKLEANGMEPSEQADRRTLIRRVHFDLLGLPPTPEEVEAFVQDKGPLAYETMVDRALASPHYGERWARHWLDVARYADTKGYVFQEERRYAYAYTYRDYVIRAFNEDLPFDRFIIEQIAADRLDLGEDKRPLAAMGFLTLGRRFLNNQPDIIADRIDVVTRGFMALTVQCARCHDHKYDPIPIEDYYSLYGVFSSSHEPEEKPLLGGASLPKEYPAYLEEKKKREEELRKFREEKEAEVFKEQRGLTGEYLLAAHDAAALDDRSAVENLAKKRKLAPIVLRRWMDDLAERRKKGSDPVFAPWFAFAAVEECKFGEKAPEIAARFAADESINPLVAKAFAEEIPEDLKEVAARYQTLFDEADAAWEAARKEKAEAKALASADEEALRQILHAENAPPNLSPGQITRLFDVPDGQKNRALRRNIEALDAVHPGSPPRGMVLYDNEKPTTPRVFIRGNARNPGEEVPRQFLALIAGEDREPFQNGSGRLELARAIASEDNPLTARVIVNRVWLRHFGAGLVRTPSDFGIRSDPPTHPELLDYLASRFMAEGWSLKKLHRLILLSSTYRQTSAIRADYAEKDPNNMLVWRMNRQRLEFEPFRDTLLAVSGKLNLEQGGQAVDITTQPFTTRRTVYSFIERQNLPGIFRTFDFASPDTHNARRFETSVPQQALFMINSPFVAGQARSFAARPEVRAAGSRAGKITELYRIALQRPPSSRELALAERFIQEQSEIPPPPPPIPTWQYGRGRLEPGSYKLLSFEPLPHFTGEAWQGGSKLPDEKLGWLTLNAGGGHPGQGLDNVIIRRWTAPRDATISISGEIEHPAEPGNGVRAHIISSREGTLGFWPVYDSKMELKIPRVEVKRGDTIDFAVDSNGDLNSDSFNWAPVITALSGSDEDGNSWDARKQFAGPDPEPLGPLEKFAQVLLMSNELAFVD